MSDRQRLADLKDNLDILYEKLGSFQKELIISASEPIRFELKQRIKREMVFDLSARWKGHLPYKVSNIWGERGMFSLINRLVVCGI
ncbi:hypothetical protein [Lyngbya aestuarii]|uniref:hypothetical protein n=1 Tax=Lyngbya aestuarii TaxID=118322 RepID=UPI00058ED76B|nr:hypothetical protein [Lyngbya aestuarii]